MTSESLAQAVQDKVAALSAELRAKAEANLSGEILQTRSGALKASIRAEVTAASDAVTATIASVGVPYAAIQERGGETPPHAILPVKAQALAFAGGFARRVDHPGSRMPAHLYLAGALDALAPDIAGGLKQAVRAALGAG